VAFHTGVADPVQHAARLVRKAVSLGSRVLVVGQAQPVQQLDELLWTTEPGSFVPHAHWKPEARGSTRLKRAPVWLCSQPVALLQAGRSVDWPEVWINLGASAFEAGGSALSAAGVSFSKVIELVSTEPDARLAGQQRWRSWREQGVVPAHHAFS
jgi:DNA polymerase-3 subunit chi